MMMVSDQQAGREVAAGEFAVSRIVRIVPLYWLFTAIVAVLAVSGSGLVRSAAVSGESFILSFLFVPYKGADGIAPILGVGWTLNYEMWFYAAFALMLHLSMWHRIMTMAVVFLVLFAIGHLSTHDGEVSEYLRSSITFDFLAGMLIYALYRKGFRHSVLHALGLICSAAALFAWSVSQGDPAPALRFLMWGMPAAIVVFAALSLPEVKGGAGRLIVLLGDASYSTYLSHLFTIGAVYAVARHFSGLSFGVVVTASFIASLIVGVGAYRMVEQPLLHASRRGVRRWLQRSA